MQKTMGEKSLIQQPQDGEDKVIDEEEFKLLSIYQLERQAYKSRLEEKKALDVDMVETEQKIQACKAALVRAFEAWYQGKYSDLKQQQLGGVAKKDISELYSSLEEQQFGGA